MLHFSISKMSDWLNVTCFLVKIATKHKHECLKTSWTSYFKLPDSAEATSHRLYSSSSVSHHFSLIVLFLCPGTRSASSPSPSAAARAHTEGPSDLLLETPYYNFYQPSRYPTYYGNLYNYPQYQVTHSSRSAYCLQQSVWSGANGGVSVGPACWIRWFDRNFKQLGELARKNLSVCVKLQFIILLL